MSRDSDMGIPITGALPLAEDRVGHEPSPSGLGHTVAIPSAVEFKGYAAVFNLQDRIGDKIRPGAFARTLKDREQFPLYWNHHWDNQIGSVVAVEDDYGLQVTGTVTDERVKGLVERGEITGLSIGYVAKHFTRRHCGGRILKRLHLHEVSLTECPMHPKARAQAIEARQGQDAQRLDRNDESAVATPCAQGDQP